MNWTTRLSSWAASNPRALDLALFAGALVMALGSLTEDSPDDRPITVFTFLALLAGTVPILWRRRVPVVAMVASATVTYSYWIYDYPGGGTWPATTILIVSLALEVQSRRTFLIAAYIFLAVTTAVLFAGWLYDGESEVTPTLIATNLIVYVTAVLFGDSLRNRRIRIRALEAEAERAQLEQQQLSERAVTDERNRIARELHDVVAHSMSVMVVQAEAAQRVIGRNDDQAREAVASIADAGRESLADMRRMLGVLRSADETEFTPAPGVASIDALAEQCRSAGLPVDVEVSGETRELPASVELSLYRIVQESLTNSLRHAGKAAAEVRLAYTDEGVDLAITDDGRGAAGEASRTSAGHGLIGMRERVETYGGEFRAGPRTGGGFEVQAHIPIGSS